MPTDSFHACSGSGQPRGGLACCVRKHAFSVHAPTFISTISTCSCVKYCMAPHAPHLTAHNSAAQPGPAPCRDRRYHGAHACTVWATLQVDGPSLNTYPCTPCTCPSLMPARAAPPASLRPAAGLPPASPANTAAQTALLRCYRRRHRSPHLQRAWGVRGRAGGR